jgi:hypothetical protein
MTTDKYLSVKEISEITGRAEISVYRLIRRLKAEIKRGLLPQNTLKKEKGIRGAVRIKESYILTHYKYISIDRLESITLNKKDFHKRITSAEFKQVLEILKIMQADIRHLKAALPESNIKALPAAKSLNQGQRRAEKGNFWGSIAGLFKDK